MKDLSMIFAGKRFLLPGLLAVALLPAAAPLCGQTVRLMLPARAGEPLVVMLKCGLRVDTVYTGWLDAEGVATVDFSGRQTAGAGMARIAIGADAAFEFIVNGENFSLRCDEAYPHGNNVVFAGSAENAALQQWFGEQALRRKRTALLTELSRMYAPVDGFYPALTDERRRLAEAEAQFEEALAASRLYAAGFVRLHGFLNDRVATAAFADSAGMATVRRYVVDSLDVDALYGSGLWFDVLNGLLAIYDNGTPFHRLYVADMSQALLRTRSEAVYEELANDLFAICEAMGWNDLEEELAYFLINDGRIRRPSGRLQALLADYRVVKGCRAPALTQGKMTGGKTLLVFYRSDGGRCEEELRALAGAYGRLAASGVRVIALSSDTDIDVFRNLSRSFPWRSSYCDGQGFGGADFKRYGVTAAPVFFVIERGHVVGRYARLVDTGIVPIGEGV